MYYHVIYYPSREDRAKRNFTSPPGSPHKRNFRSKDTARAAVKRFLGGNSPAPIPCSEGPGLIEDWPESEIDGCGGYCIAVECPS